MKKALLSLMFVTAGAQANWTDELRDTGPTQPQGGSLPVIVGTAPDAIGDAFGLMSPNLDVSSLSAWLTGGNIAITMNFDTPITPVGTGNPEDVIGFLEIDADQDVMTGNAPGFDIFCPSPTQLGVDYSIDLGSVIGGQVDVLDINGLVGTVPISFTATSFTIDLPLSLIGNPANVHMASVIGTGPEPTDCVPDGALLAAGVPSIPVPTLSQWMLIVLAMLLAALGISYVRRKNPA